MTTYFVECYWPGVDEELLVHALELLREERGTGAPGAVDWLSSILIPDDEIVLHIAEGLSVEAVRVSAQRAGVAVERIVGCVHVTSRALGHRR